MTPEELLERYAAGERDFTGVQFKNTKGGRIDLSGANLSGAIFRNASFPRGSRFKKTNLSGSALRSLE
ncbi:pentapeptide repeat-containing protein [Baaleninema simplex]|uniref:pentapeptide repeat-containing protein n=1 Tax=Baaleninema simplex TaxID=2862350 RepID=UPI001FDEB7A1|nr:pentapeptide repeat-containing protein [Baaleninema simplex]